MKKNIRQTFLAGVIMLSILSIVLIFSCKKEAVQSLGNVPVASFTATVNADGHSATLINTTPGPTIAPYWSAPAINLGYGDLKGDTIHLNFTFPNTYAITMLISGKGGLDSLSQNVTTTQADPTACNPNTPLGFIASCTQKTWKFNPVAGALAVSQYAANVNDWWQNGAADVAPRSCFFNDTYTFSFNASGDFVYDDGGDFFGDGYMGDNTSTCQPDANFTAGQKPWGSGHFHYAVIPTGGVKGLGQLKVIGLGAHIGIPKAINGTDAFAYATASSVTYDIWSMEHVSDNTGTYDLLTLTFHYGNWSATDGWWTYQLRSY